MSFPSFASGEVLTAADMNAVGLWLVKTQTIGTAVSTVTVTNAFSATYDNYLITISGGTASLSDAGFILQLGTTATGYKSVLYYQDYTGSNPVVLGNTTIYVYAGRTGSNGHSAIIDVISPFQTKTTSFRTSGSSPTYNTNGAAVLNNTTSYTDFLFSTSAGTVTGGTVRVYGYRN